MDKKEIVVDKLKKLNQEHIIKWMDKLDEDDRNKLIEQVLNLNIDEVVDLYNNLSKTFEIGNKRIEKINASSMSNFEKLKAIAKAKMEG